MEKTTKIPLFRRCVIQNFPFIEEDFDALTDYGLLCKVVEYLNKVIEQTNATSTQVEELSVAFNTLKDYVDHYFDNLDVQEEINNKLDEMAEAGTLQEIIAEYLGLGTMFTFNTVADMIASEALINGSKCQTLGKNTINDGYGAIYIIGDSGEIELDNGLYATLLGNTQDNNYYNDITITIGRANATDYYLATIPMTDSDGNDIELYVAEDESTTPLTYAEKNFTTLTVNAGLTKQNSQSIWKQAAVISNGEILHGDLCDIPRASYNRYLGFKADRSVIDFPATTTPEVMIAQGVKNAYLVFNKCIDNGVITIPEELDADETMQRLDIGVKNDGTIIILACDGRSNHDVGFTMQESAELLLSLGCTNAWRCDGGGSTDMIYKGSKQNRNWDNNKTVDRSIYVTLNFKSKTINKQLAESFSTVGRERQLLNKQIRDDVSAEFAYKKSFLSLFNWSKTYNVIDTAGTVSYPIQCQDGYRHGSNIEAIRNESNRTIGFKVNVASIINITMTADITMTATNGFRGLRIENANGNTVNDHCTVAADVTSYGANSSYLMTMQCVVNNTTAGNEYYFKCRGQHGDDFNRITITVEEIGAAV